MFWRFSFSSLVFCFFCFNACWQGQEPFAGSVGDGAMSASGMKAHTGTDEAYQRMDRLVIVDF